MKEKELRECSTCVLCGRKIGACGVPIFYRVRIRRYGLDMRACQRQDGLGMMLGNSKLAEIMGPGEDLAKDLGSSEVTLCMECGTEKQISIAILEEGD